MFFWTLGHQYWNYKWSFALVTTFYLNLLWRGVSSLDYRAHNGLTVMKLTYHGANFFSGIVTSNLFNKFNFFDFHQLTFAVVSHHSVHLIYRIWLIIAILNHNRERFLTLGYFNLNTPWRQYIWFIDILVFLHKPEWGNKPKNDVK